MTTPAPPLSIALLTYSTRPRGGVVHTLALAEALARAGAEVTVATLARGGDSTFFRQVDPGVTIVVAPFEERAGEDVGARVLRSIGALSFAADWSSFDVVHAQDCISANAVPHCVRTVHHLDRFETPELVRCHERAIVEPRAHVCVSRAVASELEAGWGIRAVVIPNGVDAERFAAAAEDPSGQERWRDRIGSRFVLTVGGIEPRKGTLGLIEAWPAVLARYPTHRLVVAGGETLFDYRTYRGDVESRAAELGIEPLILGPVDDDELPALVAAADVLAMPSTKEGFGLAAMEALAARTTVVLSRLPVFREVFDGTARFASDDTPTGLAQAIATAIDDGQNNAENERGTALATTHTWAAAATRHLAFYQRLLETGRPSLV